MFWANRNGVFYVLDRATGEFLLGKPFVKVTWMSGFDAKGKPIRAVQSSTSGVLVYPGNQGGTNWYNPAFNPRTGLFYIPTWEETSSVFTKREQEFKPGVNFGGGGMTSAVGLTTQNTYTRTEDEGYFGSIKAIDPKTGDAKWVYKMAQVTDSGVLTTATNLVFAGGREGYFFALDARDGKLLWKSMAAMKSSVLNSLRVLVVTFLKTSPAFLAEVAGGAPRVCPAARYIKPKPPERLVAIAAVSASRFHSFIFYFSPCE